MSAAMAIFLLTAAHPVLGSEDSALGFRHDDVGSQRSLEVINETGKRRTISAKELADLPRRSASVKDHAGANVTYSGVELAEILRRAEVKLGKDLKGAVLANCVVIQAADGYQVVFSIAEVEPSITGTVVIVADQKNGKPLDAREGPVRLVVPSDKRFARWVRQVTRITVIAVGGRSATGR
jgi:DMSO/TMAO reductase YedYZ molybdopterin-dependent catalytic subunit